MSDRKRWLICTLLALILIGAGIFQAITGIEISKRVMYYIELGVMLGVLYFLVIYPKGRLKNKEQVEVIEEDEEIEEHKE